jgi:hypothetical protein
MTNPAIPTVTEVEVIGTQPKPADLRKMSYIASNENVSLAPVTYIVKITLQGTEGMQTGMGFSLYVGDERVDKYFGYKDGIFFKVNDARFLERHAGQEIRLSLDEETFYDTGKVIPSPEARSADFAAELKAALPTQEEVLM